MTIPNNNNVTGIPINYISEYYHAFLNSYKEGTSKNYRTDLNLFFKIVYNKAPKFVTLSDLENTTLLDVTSYFNYLSEVIEKKGEMLPRYKNASIKRKIKAITSFFKFVSDDKNTVNPSLFDKLNLPNPELDAESYDILSWVEAISIWEHADIRYKDKPFGKQLSLLFKLATITSVRLDALLSSEWKKHWFTKMENGRVINYVETIDKSQKHRKPISLPFYNELREHLGDNEKLFPLLYPNKVGALLKDILSDLEFDPRRNIKFHSFKKTGIMRVLEKTGNMYKAKQQGNHKSLTTTEKYYLKYKEVLTDYESYSMDEEINVLDKLSEISRDELLGAVNQLSDSSKYELLRILGKIE